MSTLHLAAALNGAGWHPAAWRGIHPADAVRVAERGLLDLVTIEDILDPSALAAVTDRIGLVPALEAVHTEPFAIASALATLNRDSHGRAGWYLGGATRPDGSGPPGPLATPVGQARFAEQLDRTADAVTVVARSWDSGNDGPPSTPARGRPPVFALGHGWETFRTAARVADVVLTVPHDAFGAAMIAEHVRAAERAAGRTGAPLRILADLVVLLDDTVSAARARLDRLDATERLETDAAIVATTASGLADLMLAWQPSGIDGYRLRPARTAEDLGRVCDELVPELQRRGAFRTAYGEQTLRARLGLGQPAARVLA